MTILSLNPGSSTLKFGLFSQGADGELVASRRGGVNGLGTAAAMLRITEATGAVFTEAVGAVDLPVAVGQILTRARKWGPIDGVACRVVHGGTTFLAPTVVTDDVLTSLRALAPLAPLHNTRDVSTIDAVRSRLPAVPVVAVFDTEFHATLPAVATTYAIDRALAARHGLRRYGFHGISYRYVCGQLTETLAELPSRLIVCHLGSGASVCAILDGKSIDTSMGMTPLEGLVMATRSGDLDPGLLLFLMRETGFAPVDLDNLLNHRSGLLGLAGGSGDFREVAARAATDPIANAALDVFAYRVSKYIGSYVVALGGLDALAFCGGIGENSAEIRARICAPLACIGVRLSEGLNHNPGPDRVARLTPEPPVSVWRVRTDEERQMATEATAVLG